MHKKRFKNRKKSPQSQRRIKTILRLLYIGQNLSNDTNFVNDTNFGAKTGRRQSEKYSYIG
jgi:hypothetical protein